MTRERTDRGSEGPCFLHGPYLEVLPWLLPYLKVWLTLAFPQAEVQTSEACVDPLMPGGQPAFSPLYPKWASPTPTSSQKILLNIPRTSFSICHSLCSQATHFYTLRHSVFQGLASSRLPPETSPSPFTSISPQPPESSHLCQLLSPVPQSRQQEAQISRPGQPPVGLESRPPHHTLVSC